MKKDLPQKSFSVAFDQMAKFLRTEVKLKDRSTKVLSAKSLSVSFHDIFKQIARMLRAEIDKPVKKRVWKTKSH
jgi:hypothetical protein